MLGTALLTSTAWGQVFPVKPVRLVVGFAAGGGTDTIARLISRKLADTWPHPLVIENRPGADGSIATELVAKAPADGYVMVMVSSAFTITPFQQKLSYDPLKDLTPVTQVAFAPDLLLVHPSLPVKTVKELIALAKARPRQLSFGSSGTGTSPYLSMELFQSTAGIDLVHVPYKGSAPAVIDLVGGHIQILLGSIPTTLPHVKSGKLRAVAVSSAQRWPSVPELPTIAESGMSGFEAATWFGMLAPGGTPAAIVNKIHGDVATALNAPDSKKFLENTGYAGIANKPDEFGAVIRKEMEKWERIIRSIDARKR
jgi:tripartite-type tricarboxylate transporter receptor subunit TctC